MLNIVYDNVTAHIENCPPDVRMVLYENLKYHPDGYEHVYRYKNGNWDGYNYLYNIANDTFRRGLIPRVCGILSKYNQAFRLVNRGKDTAHVSHKMYTNIIKPFDFQEQAIVAATDYEMGLIVSPTGTGKTVVVAKMINALCRKTIVLVTDVVLLDQMQQSLQRMYDQPIGAIGDGEFDIQDITVSTIQSLVSILKPKAKNKKNLAKYDALTKFIAKVGVVISDEAHLSDSDSFAYVMPTFVNARRVYGLSATPYGWSEKAEKRSNMELEQHFGEVIFDSRKNNFIELGLKVPLKIVVNELAPLNKQYNIHMKRGIGGKQVLDHGKNYKECLNAEILNNGAYHGIVAAKVIDEIQHGKSVFVHAVHSIEYGETLKSLLPGAVLVNGSTSRKERRAIYDAMRKKEQLVLVSDVGGTGLDIPSLDTIVLASDISDSRQLKGRVARAAKDKVIGTVIDYKIDTQFLKKHFVARESQYENDGDNIIYV